MAALCPSPTIILQSDPIAFWTAALFTGGPIQRWHSPRRLRFEHQPISGLLILIQDLRPKHVENRLCLYEMKTFLLILCDVIQSGISIFFVVALSHIFRVVQFQLHFACSEQGSFRDIAQIFMCCFVAALSHTHSSCSSMSAAANLGSFGVLPTFLNGHFDRKHCALCFVVSRGYTKII